MGQKVFGFQILFIGFYFAAAINYLTGANPLVSILAGLVLGGGCFGLLMALLPRAMFYGLVVAYFVAGVALAQYLNWGIFETLVIGVFTAGLGWAANMGVAQDAFFSRAESETEDTAADQVPIASVMEIESQKELLDAAMRAFKYSLVSEKVYKRMCREICELASGTPGPNQPFPPSEIGDRKLAALSDDERYAILELSELHLIRRREWEEVAQKMDQ
jgi:hypothetical protein